MALGRLAQGFTPGFDSNNWTKQEDQNGSTSPEYTMVPTQWFAQRFTPTISCGRLLFSTNIRLPAGASIPVGATLDVSIFNDTNSGPSGISLSGAFLPEQIIQSISSFFFHRPQPGKSDPSIQGGFISFPLTNVKAQGADSPGNGVDTSQHYFEFPAQPGSLWLPSTSHWFVMRTTSFGGNLYVAVKNDTQNTTRYTYDANGTQSSSNQDYGDLFGYFANPPGAAQTFNFQNGKTSLFTLFGEKALSTLTTPSQGQSAGIKVTEPILGTVWNATSLSGQDHIASEIAFTTSVVARRNSQGRVDVAFPMTAGGFTNNSGDGLTRMTYACEVEYYSFK